MNVGFLETAPMREADARALSPLLLAYVGDAVHDLYVRTTLTVAGGRVGYIHRDAIGNVNARAQAESLHRVEEMLDEPERDIVRRGRNAHAHHSAPRNADPADYAQATALEALLGYLYLIGRTERLQTLLVAMQRTEDACTCGQKVP